MESSASICTMETNTTSSIVENPNIGVIIWQKIVKTFKGYKRCRNPSHHPRSEVAEKCLSRLEKSLLIPTRPSLRSHSISTPPLLLQSAPLWMGARTERGLDQMSSHCYCLEVPEWNNQGRYSTIQHRVSLFVSWILVLFAAAGSHPQTQSLCRRKSLQIA